MQFSCLFARLATRFPAQAFLGHLRFRLPRWPSALRSSPVLEPPVLAHATDGCIRS